MPIIPGSLQVRRGLQVATISGTPGTHVSLTTFVKTQITHSKLVCTRTGCPPNAGTALSINGCDLTKFNIWSDNFFESLAHVCKRTQHITDDTWKSSVHIRELRRDGYLSPSPSVPANHHPIPTVPGDIHPMHAAQKQHFYSASA